MALLPATDARGKKALRILARSYVGHPSAIREASPRPGEKPKVIGVELHEVHACRDTCQRADGQWDEDKRADKRCSLLHYQGPWSSGPPKDPEWCLWLGMPPQRHLAHDPETVRLTILNQDYLYPSEPIEEGCPGGWSGCRYARTFDRFRRRRVESGLHDQNPLVHAGTDPRVLEALRCFEDEEQAAWRHVAKVRNG